MDLGNVALGYRDYDNVECQKHRLLLQGLGSCWSDGLSVSPSALKAFEFGGAGRE